MQFSCEFCSFSQSNDKASGEGCAPFVCRLAQSRFSFPMQELGKVGKSCFPMSVVHLYCPMARPVGRVLLWTPPEVSVSFHRFSIYFQSLSIYFHRFSLYFHCFSIFPHLIFLIFSSIFLIFSCFFVRLSRDPKISKKICSKFLLKFLLKSTHLASKTDFRHQLLKMRSWSRCQNHVFSVDSGNLVLAIR